MCIAAKLSLAAAAGALLVSMGGCGQTLSTPLPNVAQVPDRGDYAAQKARAEQSMNELNAKKATHEQDTLRQIEQSSR